MNNECKLEKCKQQLNILFHYIIYIYKEMGKK